MVGNLYRVKQHSSTEHLDLSRHLSFWATFTYSNRLSRTQRYAYQTNHRAHLSFALLLTLVTQVSICKGASQLFLLLVCFQACQLRYQALTRTTLGVHSDH
jgi:hypothetical protein